MIYKISEISTMILVLLLVYSCSLKDTHNSRIGIDFSVSENVNPKYNKIIEKWQAYLSMEEKYTPEKINKYWKKSSFKYPNTYLTRIFQETDKVHEIENIVISVFPINDKIWELTSMFMRKMNNKSELRYIVRVYVEQINGEYKFINSTEFLKSNFNKRTVGNITYYYKDKYEFNMLKANKLKSFNQELSEMFNIEEIRFDYFILDNYREIIELRGYEFQYDLNISFQGISNKNGARTDRINNVIYVGTDTEFYPHELVHLYNYRFFGQKCHKWFDEGFATLLGGSQGKSLDWHVGKLKVFLENNKDFVLNDIKKLEKLKILPVKDSKTKTGFMYVIGGLIIETIYNNEGFEGLRYFMSSGTTEKDFYNAVEEKFNIKKANFGRFIRGLIDAREL